MKKPDEVVAQNFDDALLSAALRCEGCTPHGQSGLFRKTIRRGFGQRIDAVRRRPLQDFGGKDVLRTGSRIGVSALDEVMLREPVRENQCNQRTGRDLNPLDLSVVCHVLQTDSRACIES